MLSLNPILSDPIDLGGGLRTSLLVSSHVVFMGSTPWEPLLADFKITSKTKRDSQT